MRENTSFPSASSTLRQTQCGGITRLVTNDLYLAAYLPCEGIHLEHVYHNGRKRAAFEFTGYGLLEKKKAYKKGRVFLYVGSFRDKLKHIRGIAYGSTGLTSHGQERSFPCPTQCVPTLKQAQA